VSAPAGRLHHVELWVPDLPRTIAEWGWPLTSLGYEQPQDWKAGPREQVDKLAAEAPEHGWTLLFPDRHPHAGGPGHYAAYLTSTDAYEVELAATTPAGSPS